MLKEIGFKPCYKWNTFNTIMNGMPFVTKNKF